MRVVIVNILKQGGRGTGPQETYEHPKVTGHYQNSHVGYNVGINPRVRYFLGSWTLEVGCRVSMMTAHSHINQRNAKETGGRMERRFYKWAEHRAPSSELLTTTKQKSETAITRSARFINARRRIVQPMIDQSNRAGTCIAIRLAEDFEVDNRVVVSSYSMQDVASRGGSFH
ncbi:hypothetical protein KGM_212808 [Danaus plexippus plexippus]|uniref:Uncharacterized protein n=1 Tax=Danaus plexippus plexippus TaxID=278856 RepID=A0A212F6D7_DANPL|nr:hypothetical protein KGM_212808 [Danaus plexippus plexippus]